MVRDWRESKLNREKVGEDKFGNEYYQYYSNYGLPTRKEIKYVNWNRAKSFEDVHFFPWLRKQEFLPPTEEELKQLYAEDKERKMKALKYNKISKELDAAYYEKKALISKVWNERPLSAEDFEPEKWEPGSRRQLGEEEKKKLSKQAFETTDNRTDG